MNQNIGFKCGNTNKVKNLKFYQINAKICIMFKKITGLQLLLWGF